MTTVLPTFSSYKSSLYRQHQKNYPELPETANDVKLEGKWTETLDSSHFLLHHDRQSNIIIFASDHMLRLIADADTLYMDGTFSSCPRIFYQLFTINIIVDGKQVPALYALLPSKSRETYNKMFTSIKEQMQNLNFTLTPSKQCLLTLKSPCDSPYNFSSQQYILKVVTFTLPRAYTIGYRLMDWRSTTGKTHPTSELLSTVQH